MRAFTLLAISIAGRARLRSRQFSFNFPDAGDQRFPRADHRPRRHLRQILLKAFQHPFFFFPGTLHRAGVGSLSVE